MRSWPLAQLRAKAMKMKANAVIAVDIDYADVGSGKGMLMVCATGTAVRVNNPEVFEKQTYEHLKELNDKHERLNCLLGKYKPYIVMV